MLGVLPPFKKKPRVKTSPSETSLQRTVPIGCFFFRPLMYIAEDHVFAKDSHSRCGSKPFFPLLDFSYFSVDALRLCGTVNMTLECFATSILTVLLIVCSAAARNNTTTGRYRGESKFL
ncbi:hypothetical protein CEXT_274541 [Caerostris extrusa]|uniref:Uncharacterized protein n=1 Tax=Caerostris extrusa TaxID=172846 RepID=A0AAV4YG79_CAEEX|nr:hypothetical protein CEXT_274541 [Caerostris extrusa]